MGTTKLRASFSLLLLALGVLFAPPALVLGALGRRWARSTWDARDRWQGIIAFCVFNLGIYGLIWWRWNAVASLLQAELHALSTLELRACVIEAGKLWLLNVLLTPAFALLQEAYARFLTGKGAGQSNRQPSIPDEVDGAFVLGAPLKGDLKKWVRHGCCTYPSPALKRHLALLGSSGSGKTETSLRIALGAASTYKWKVFLIDAKGDLSTAARFLTAMRQLGLTKVKMFPHEPFCGWRGSSAELHNRLMEVIDYSEPYYSDAANAILDFALNAPMGPPHSGAEFLGRLELYTLKKLYAGTSEGAQLKRFHYELVQGTFLRYRSFFAAVKSLLDGEWSFEDVDAGYLLLDSLSLKSQAASLGRFFVEAFAQYIAHRQDSHRGVLLIIDELSAIALKSDVASLFERIRGFGGHIVVTAQSYAGMGQQAERVLNAATGLIVHHCDDPERLVARAGTRLVPDFSHQIGSDGATGYGTMRMREQLRVDPNEVRELEVGVCFVISGGRAEKVRVNALQLPEQAVQEVLDQISQPQGITTVVPVPPGVSAPRNASAQQTNANSTQKRGSKGLPSRGNSSSPSTSSKQLRAPRASSLTRSVQVEPAKQNLPMDETMPPLDAEMNGGTPVKSEQGASQKLDALTPSDNDLFPELH